MPVLKGYNFTYSLVYLVLAPYKIQIVYKMELQDCKAHYYRIWFVKNPKIIGKKQIHTYCIVC